MHSVLSCEASKGEFCSGKTAESLVVSICASRPRGDIFWVKILILTTLIFQKRQENQEDIHVIANQAFPLPGSNYQEVGASSPKYTGKKRLNLQKFLKNWKTLS